MVGAMGVDTVADMVADMDAEEVGPGVVAFAATAVGCGGDFGVRPAGAADGRWAGAVAVYPPV